MPDPNTVVLIGGVAIISTVAAGVYAAHRLRRAHAAVAIARITSRPPYRSHPGYGAPLTGIEMTGDPRSPGGAVGELKSV